MANSDIQQPTLEGFASLPADTFAEGPSTGEGISANGRTGPFEGQPVQGFSGVQFAPGGDGSNYWFLSDNGFGSKANSSDYLLRLYQVDPNFVGSESGDGSVEVQGFVQLSDPDKLIPFDIQQGGTTERNLTGSDFDVESFTIDANGDIWIGEEFGPYILHFDGTGKLVEAPIATPNITSFKTLSGEAPIVIGHRGASGDRPEHTLEAYQLAMEQGADFVEPDLVITKDGVLIARHEPVLDDTTNVAEVFGAERKSTKNLDGTEITAYFAEDFTLAEIKQLRAVQSRDFRSPDFDGQFEIPTFQEVIKLVQKFEADTGKKIGIYPETKHPTFFDIQGLSLEKPLISTLQVTGFTDPSRIFIQSFEFENLIKLQGQLDDVGLGDLPLVQLYGNTTDSASPSSGFSVPYDIRYNVEQGNDLAAIYGQDFLDAVEAPLSADTIYSDLDNADLLKVISAKYAEGAGPWKNNFLLRESIDPKVDGDGDGNAEIGSQLTGEVTSFVDDAHAAGLQVHPYTLRNEERFLTLNSDGTPQTPEQEFVQLTQIGVDGFFTDFPETGAKVVSQMADEFVYSPDHPGVLAGDLVSNLPRSRGYEGMAFSPDRSTLYPMLEGTVLGDPDGSLRIYEFDPASSVFQGLVGLYQMESSSHAIGDFTPINDDEFLVIERDGKQAADAAFKKIFKVDLSEVNSNGFVMKEELVDLLNIADPNDLNGDGSTTFNFPFVTIEDVLVLDKDTIIVANDNNFPFSIGRDFSGNEIDNNEIIEIKLDTALDLDARLGVAGFAAASGGGIDDDGIEIGSNINETIANALFEGNGDDGIDIEGDNSKVTIKNILSTANTEEGIEIDGSKNTIKVANASFSKNGDDGFDIDATGSGNSILIQNTSFQDNSDDGFDVLGVGNSIRWESVGTSGNIEEGFEIDGQNNLVTINNSSFTKNGDDGFDIDATGTGNNITISNSSFSENGGDGFDVFGIGNRIAWTNVTSTGNTESGFEIDGSNNLVMINYSSLSSNVDDGFQIDDEGSGNIVGFTNTTLSNNIDGIDINGSKNIINLFQTVVSGNSSNGVEIEGDNNTVAINSTTFNNNGEYAVRIEGDNNIVTIANSAFLGSGARILDTGLNNTISVLNNTGLDMGSVMIADSSTLLTSLA